MLLYTFKFGVLQMNAAMHGQQGSRATAAQVSIATGRGAVALGLLRRGPG